MESDVSLLQQARYFSLSSQGIKSDTTRDVVAPVPLDFIVDLVTSSLSCESVYLFGSRARGNSTEESDIDLIAVIKTAGVLRSLLGVRNLRRRLESLPVPTDVYAISTLACSRNKDCLTLNLLHKERRLLYGKDSLGGQLGVLGFVPSRDSVIRGTCYNIRWFLRCIKFDDRVVSIDRRGLAKLVQVLKDESDLSTQTMPPLLTLVKQLEHEVGLETPSPKAVCKALADCLGSLMDEFSASFPSRISQMTSILIDKGRLIPRVLFDKHSACSRITKALLCLLRSLESDVLDDELIHQAVTYLGYLLYDGIQNPNEDAVLLLMKVRNAIREYWDTIMRVPFGSLVIHRAFNIVLL